MSGEIVAKQQSCLDYGHTVQQSHLCPICKSSKCNDINLLRASEHLTYKQIADKIGASIKDVEKHFTKHFLLKEPIIQLLAVKENLNPVSQEIITKIFEGDSDIVSATGSVLKVKAERLLSMKERIKALDDELEMESYSTDEEGNELFGKSHNYKAYVALNDAANKLENSILEGYKIIDNKLFSTTQADLQRAILDFKLKYLQKVLDHIVLIFNTYEAKGDIYASVIRDLKIDLAKQFDFLELEVVKSGGTMLAGQKAIEAEVISDKDEEKEPSW